MSHILKITNNKIIAFVLAFLLSFVLVGLTHAQTASTSADQVAQKYGVKFPVAELGSCSDIASCRNFCQDPVNSNSCINYAKLKGFYKEDTLQTKKDQILGQAKSILGCDSVASCQNFCKIPANYDKCHSFAQTQGITGGVVQDPGQAFVVEKAKQVLGCTSADSCKSYCEQDANRGKCADFAKQVGLHGGEHKVGPGGCTSEATCKSFCADPNNFQVCSGFSAVSGATFTGPGGCNNEASCKSYCQANPQDCGFKGGDQANVTQARYNPQEMCNRTPNCSWSGNGCQCGFYGETKETVKKAGEYAAYCQTNPDKCKPGQSGGFESEKARNEFENFCTTSPDKCKPIIGGPVLNPANECVRYGCNWANNTCQCSGFKDTYSYPTPYSYSYPTPGGSYSYPTPYSYSYPTPYSNSRDAQESACKQGGGSCDWSSGYCNCIGYKYPTPTYSYPTPSGTYSYPTPYSYSYPTPGGTYPYPTPYSYSYPTPSSYSYPTPQAYSYPTPQTYSYPTPQVYSYPTPQVYSYPTPQAYSYPTPQTYSYPTPVLGISTVRSKSWLDRLRDWLGI